MVRSAEALNTAMDRRCPTEGIAPSDNLEEGRKVIADSINQTFQSPKWFANEVRRIGTRDWIVLKFAESASPTPMRHIVLASVQRKQVLVFNLRSTVNGFRALSPGCARPLPRSP